MPEETLVAASSPAEVPDVFNGGQPTLAEYNSYRESGELPERFKPADTADPAPAEETTEGEEPESEPASEPEQQQEKKPKGKTAEDRIAQLEATIEKIKRGAGLERKTEPAPVTEQPKASPQSYAEWEKAFNPEKWIEAYGKDHPEASYERANAAMFSHMLNAREHFQTIAQQLQSQAKELNDQVAAARARYGEQVDEVLKPTAAILNDAQIPEDVKRRIGKSSILPDLVFTLGENSDDLEKFVQLAKTDPDAARDHIVLVEQLIKAELSGDKTEETPRDKDGKFKSAAPPAKPKTSAPKPPSPVSGASTGAFDVSDTSLSGDEWMRRRNEQVARKG